MTYQEPFPNLSFLEIATRVGRQHFRLELPSSVPHRIRALIESMWDADREQRPTVKEVIRELQAALSQESTARFSSESGTAPNALQKPASTRKVER
jgi:hypothetical protein